ncbi:hypothetical protein [Stappia sp.]|uniref:hypothetical protein n=1 Tax=Stappia sp. TaxID=1870903 RepID=UPI003C7E9621
MARKTIEGEIVKAQEQSVSASSPHIVPATSEAGRKEVEKAADDAGLAARIRTKWLRAKQAGASLAELERLVNEERNERISYEIKRVTDARKLQIQEQYEMLVGRIRMRVGEMTAEATKHYLDMADRDYEYYEDKFDSIKRRVKEGLDTGKYDQERADREISRARKNLERAEGSIDRLVNIMEHNVEKAVEEALTRNFE